MERLEEKSVSEFLHWKGTYVHPRKGGCTD